MANRKRERSRKVIDNPTEPKTTETKKGRQTKFIIDAGDIQATPEELEAIKNGLLKAAVSQLKTFKTLEGAPASMPKVGIEDFSLSFSAGFSLGS